MSETRPQTTASMVGELLGSYRVIRELSTGGMGTVYRAEHQLLGKTAAIKVLRNELTANEELLERFFNEAKAATAIRHPGIVEVYDFGYTDDGRAYIVMELLDGEPLGERIRRRGRLTEVETVKIGRHLAGALRAAHAKGIVHRDLKPDNVFLVPEADGQGDRAKILDFGIAKLVDLSPSSVRHTQTGVLMGTPLYMAPEQARAAREIDHRADLYSLGCMLYEMLVGQPPFIADGAGEIIAMQLFAPPEPPSKRLSALNPALEAIVLKLLEKEPHDRYPQALDVQDALTALEGRLSGQLAQAYAGESKRFTLSNAQGITEPMPAPILPTPRPSSDQSLRLSLIDRPPELDEKRSPAMPVIAALVTVAIAAAVVLLVMTRGSDAPKAEPVPPAPVATPVPAPAPTPTPAKIVTPPVVTKGPSEIVVVDEPEDPKPKKPKVKTETPAKTPDHTGLVTSPGKDPCRTPEGYPCENDIGELPKRKPTPEAPQVP